jgi:hypothetical protein
MCVFSAVSASARLDGPTNLLGSLPTARRGNYEFCPPSKNKRGRSVSKLSRLQIGDTADYDSALRLYVRSAPSSGRVTARRSNRTAANLSREGRLQTTKRQWIIFISNQLSRSLFCVRKCGGSALFTATRPVWFTSPNARVTICYETEIRLPFNFGLRRLRLPFMNRQGRGAKCPIKLA